MARQESMAKINAALERSRLSLAPQSSTPDAPSPDVTIAPGLSTDTPLSDQLPELSEGQKRYFDAQRQKDRDTLADQKQLAREQEAEFRQQIATEQAEEDAFKASAKATTETAKRILTGTATKLGSLPQPGSIVFPLVVLAVFFLLLLPVNGHTRFVWLWMVLSGNAQVTQTAGSSQAGSNSIQEVGEGVGSSPTNEPTSTSQPLFTLPTSFAPLQMYTGVEDL